MYKLITGALALCGGLVPQCTGPAESPTVYAPIEVVVNDGDPVPNLAPPQTLTICYPGADGYDDGWVRQQIADGGATFELRDGVACGVRFDY